MDNDDDGYLNSTLDPKFMLAATTLLIAAGVGTWKAFSPVFAAGRHRDSQRLEQAGSALKDNADSISAAEKKKRNRDRRKRAPLPKLARAASNVSSQGAASGGRKVIRQPSALPGRRQRQQSPSASESMAEVALDETPTPLAASDGREAQLPNLDPVINSGDLDPENIPLPLSPGPSRSRSPAPVPSPCVSTSASTSGTPLTPASLATSQLSLPPLGAETSSWQWNHQNLKDSSPAPQRGRKPHVRHAENAAVSPSVATFPTLNTLPPPNTPMEAQVEFMRHQVDSYRAQEEATRAREEALLMDIERLRAEAELSRQDVSRLQWQLSDMSQREERLLAQVNALTMQMQSMHQGRQTQPPPLPVGIPVPLYQPQPIPYPQIPAGHLGFYHPHGHPYANGSPMAGPSSLASPPHLHPLMTAPTVPAPFPSMGTPLDSLRGSSRGSARAKATSSTNEDGTADRESESNISFGLMEAIFKHPESYTSSHTSGSARSARSPPSSLSLDSVRAKSVHSGTSPRLSGAHTLERETSGSTLGVVVIDTQEGHLMTDSRFGTLNPSKIENSLMNLDNSSIRGDFKVEDSQYTHSQGQEDRHEPTAGEHLPTPPFTDEADENPNHHVDIYY
ncbi:hypothetical protein FRC19_008347 [Serendipita sp. 401]|nr:hypothetical protein FRC19_008347 [Serendipita sp. 401]KAG9058724.1 hypothetical protein FS842_003513 [Serendipita sp. 407]